MEQELKGLLHKVDRSLNRMSLLIAIFLVVYIASLPVRFYLQKKNIEQALGPAPIIPVWSQIHMARDNADFEEEKRLLTKLLEKNPNDYQAHSYLGQYYIAVQQLDKAQVHLTKAYELNPIPEFKEYILAIKNKVEENRTKSIAP